MCFLSMLFNSKCLISQAWFWVTCFNIHFAVSNTIHCTLWLSSLCCIHFLSFLFLFKCHDIYYVCVLWGWVYPVSGMLSLLPHKALHSSLDWLHSPHLYVPLCFSHSLLPLHVIWLYLLITWNLHTSCYDKTLRFS